MNTALRDLASGSVLFRHSSRADDNARQLRKAREQERADRTTETHAQDSLEQAITRLEERIRHRNAPREEKP